MINIRNRSSQPEIMDDFSMEGELLRRTLDKIAWINQWLGGNRITMDGLKMLLSGISKDEEIIILDLGCGNGDILRLIAEFGRKNSWNFKLLGIDANLYTVNYARQLSVAYPEISYIHTEVPSKMFSNLKCDIILSTLFLHHFSDEDALKLLEKMYQKTNIGIVVNDLERSKWAYILFQLLSLLIPNPMVQKDGLTSILRGFKRHELEAFEKKLSLENSQINWRWAFRYQWVIFKSRK